ncbi:NAD(P)/FAD-dependent oxidoreductase [Rhodovulum sp. DZ06]|uniref:NAD(P)/FAD-dependent oxidoreductase n=1 Tax=Rhodovulum sp. DZ06 TaxID=3425126 RepID=UPI003D32C536
MKIAVIGAGISGIGAALALQDRHEVSLFERDARFGGHANTVDAPRVGARSEGKTVAVDTGFIVFNQRNYPNLCGLFEHLGVPTKWSDMSFGFSLSGGSYEYACDDLDRLFAQRRNAFNPRHLKMLREVLRFNAIAPAELESGDLEDVTLGDWIAKRGFSDVFRDRFILPMGGAIWSCSTRRMLDFPARSFIAFFRNHDLMTGLDPAQRWRTVDGGSREYVSRAVARLGDAAQAGRAVTGVERIPGGVRVGFRGAEAERFDKVIFATHAEDTLDLLLDASHEERSLLSAFPFSSNRAVLHSDPALMPRRRKVWSSWNFLSDGAAKDAERPAQVTYWMNRLQGLPEDTPLFVSLNPSREIRDELIHGEFAYEHPLFTARGFRAQRDMHLIQDRGGVLHAGAWMGYGFHEDGLRAGLEAAAVLGARPAWARDVTAPAAPAQAAE